MPRLRKHRSPAAFHVMLKPRGAIVTWTANIAIFYPKKSLSGQPFPYGERATGSVHRQLSSPTGPEVTFAWQGRRANTMGLDFFKLAVELQAEVSPAGYVIQNAFQPTGRPWMMSVPFFSQARFLIGLSLDGPLTARRYRVTKGAANFFARLWPGWPCLNNTGSSLTILTTVHAANASPPGGLPFLTDEVGTNLSSLSRSLSEITDGYQEGNRVTPFGNREQYGQFCRHFDEWVRRDGGRIFVQLFEVALACAGRAGRAVCF